jgi:hypothetical protein
MATPALIPLAGAAAGFVASGAVTSISNGLSFLAELTKGSEVSAPDAPVEESQPTTGEQRKALDKALKDFVKRLRERLQLSGVDVNQPLELEEEPWGSIAVDQNHPQQAQIEAALAADPLLSSEFHQLADQYRQLAEAESQDVNRSNPFTVRLMREESTAGFGM